ncbi:enoyl-CoA hydratase-related protein [Haloechinothrix sp. LS1_15]|uniref:enoyl-CoA hydratase-related protein n=1 Tax=Haloechinothrix sp. LS1_15 TaxID=2652248 RepID=UPI002946B2DC|nr:enoyl-CoA hydratase-related protein [Haloechinothrix sp. LS1_15]MDV6011249.1 enoyl-CoA hydratase [Haloechinothrix sp. LS1_15]
MDYTEVSYSVADRIATIALNRPEARNGYTIRMSDELADAFSRADADDEVRVVVFTGQGSDFCVGADLSSGSLNAADDAGQVADQQEWQEPAGRCTRRIFDSSKPVIAAIRGAAVGAGSTIILPADYRLAATDARFGFVFSRRGIYPEGASTWFLPRLVGLGAAMDWMISGRVFGAEEAAAAGLVHRLHEPDELLDAAYELARDLAANTAPVSVAVIRQMLFRLTPLDSPDPVHRVDSRLIAECATSPDAVEGIMSFLERRSPEFTGTVSKDVPGWLPWRGGDHPPT